MQAGGHEFESRYLHVDNYESSRLRLADEFRKLVFVKAYDRMWEDIRRISVMSERKRSESVDVESLIIITPYLENYTLNNQKNRHPGWSNIHLKQCKLQVQARTEVLAVTLYC